MIVPDVTCPNCGSKEVSVNKAGAPARAIEGGVLSTRTKETEVICLNCRTQWKITDVAAPPNMHDAIDAEALRIIRAGQVLNAVKYYAQATNTDLRSAKLHIDGLRRKNNVAGPNPKGCLGMMLLPGIILAEVLYELLK
jgi:hypothetical protein